MARQSIPQNYIRSSGSLMESFNTVGEWSLSGSGTIQADVNNNNHLQITALNGGTVNADKIFVSHKIDSKNQIRFSVFADYPKNISSFKICFASATDFSKYVYAEYGAGLKDGWNNFAFNVNQMNAVGVGDYSGNVIKYRISVTATTGEDVSLTFKDMIGDVVGISKAQILFDDGRENVYTNAFPVMNSLGLPGTVYIIGDNVGTAGYLTWSQISELKENGWTIGNHTMSHTLQYSPDEFKPYDLQYSEISNCRDLISAHGCGDDGSHIAYPGGQYNSDTLAVMDDLGMKTGRTTKGNYQIMPDSIYQLGVIYITNSFTTAQAKAAIQSCLKNGGSALLTFHNVSDGGTLYEYSISNFTIVMNYLKTIGIDVVNMADWFTGLTNPRKII